MIVQKLKSIINHLRVGLLGGNPKLPYAFTAVIAFVIVILGINTFVELTARVKGDMLKEFDDRATNFFLNYRNEKLTDYLTFVTDIGDVKGYLVLLVISIILTFVVGKKWRYVIQNFLVLILATLSNMALKRFIDRARPEIEHLVTVKTLSYPSGHAMSSMAFYGFLIYLVYKFNVNTWLKVIIIAVLTVLILSIGVSRIYLGVHFPSDVIGGWIAGIIWVFFCILIFNLIEAFRKDPKT